ncbi:hypothetical protein SNOUR_20910 [Streptomyces noursei ATCC 11455]|nr:hypothetical protein SNOUR_20910 [Streptomyces noursei ATCC 11455]
MTLPGVRPIVCNTQQQHHPCTHALVHPIPMAPPTPPPGGAIVIRGRRSKQVPQIITDTAAAALHFDVAPATVRSWLRRGHVEHHGHDRQGRALVDLHEIRDYLRNPKAAQRQPERTG